ncbi:MAG: 1-deoxy-D-xylulose-5-phosphate reductoisomerase [Bacteroidales bacterium]|jgi:1-deoxy-D-xylulose-5-phosphate reductoisomerase|nr:1-deoxy-D-xylulose-5-phosphate reductoisomerase [Bacteroidales bacterium]
MKKRIAILGSTGSIGSQTLAVVREHPDLFSVSLLTANNSVELLEQQAREFNVPNVVICNPEKYGLLSRGLSGTGTKVHSGMDAVCDLVTAPEVDIVVASMVGFSGLRPTLAAIGAGKPIALANKETLVAAGSIVMGAAAKNGVDILPVDSEHSAIFQCLLGAGPNKLEKIHLTASGGPFRTWPKEEIAKATKDMALKHPNWNMGAKITIDSATMMNKGFEVIEAKWLFDTDASKINVLVHPESIIHSMVEFADGAVIAQMGWPDMREPIQLALSYPERLTLSNRKLDFPELGKMTFHRPDLDKFPCLSLAFEAIGKGGNVPAALNAANEAAVAAFLHDKIGFYDISGIVSDCIASVEFIAEPTIEEIFSTNDEVFAKAKEKTGRW